MPKLNLFSAEKSISNKKTSFIRKHKTELK